MAYWRLFYHLVWATKNREPLINSFLEDELRGFLVGKAEVMRWLDLRCGYRRRSGPFAGISGGRIGEGPRS